jgi:predicted dehydrogenase
LLRLGLVGCGRIAERGWIPATTRVGGVRLTGVADLDPARCSAVAPGVPAFPEAAELRGHVDAVVIATAPAAHLEVARALEGLPAIVEKPPAPDGDGARALTELDPPPFTGFNRRFDSGVFALRKRLRGRSVARRLRLRLHYSRDDWAHVEARDEDALLDGAPHLIDLARWIADADVERVRADTVERDACVLELDLGGMSATVECRLDRPWRELVEGYAPPGRRPIARHRRGGRVRLRRSDALVSSVAAQLAAFADAVAGRGAGELATAADGARVMETIDAARASAGEWREVSCSLC